MNSLQIIESILTEGQISSTYKYALLASIIDYIIEEPLQTPKNNFHFIPIFVIAKQFLAYYYPLALDNIRQGTSRRSETGIAIARYITEFVEDAEKSLDIDFSLKDPNNTYRLYVLIEQSEKLSKQLISLLFNIRKVVLDQPIRFINNIRGKNISLFGILTKDIPFEESFETHLEHGLRLSKRVALKCSNFDELLEVENCNIFIGHQTYSELSRFRFLLRDVILKRWAQITFERFKSKNIDILHKFDLWKNPLERDTQAIIKYKRFYQKIGLNRCIYCGKLIEGKEYHLDHFLPWCRMPVDRFWNLYPACKECNFKKSDRIPVLNETLTANIKKHLKLCIEELKKEQELVARDLRLLYKQTFNSEYEYHNSERITEEIIEYLRNLSANLLDIIPEHAFSNLS